MSTVQVLELNWVGLQDVTCKHTKQSASKLDTDSRLPVLSLVDIGRWTLASTLAYLFVSIDFIRIRAQELCECRGGRPRLPIPNSPMVSVDVKQH